MAFATSLRASPAVVCSSTRRAPLDDPAGAPGTTQFAGISNSGEIVGTYATMPVGSDGLEVITYGFIEHGSTYTSLDDPSAGTTQQGVQLVGTWPFAINDHGQVVGFYDYRNFIRAFEMTP